MFLTVAVGVLLVASCDYALPVLPHLEVKSFSNNRGSAETVRGAFHNELVRSSAEDFSSNGDSISKLLEGKR